MSHMIIILFGASVTLSRPTIANPGDIRGDGREAVTPGNHAVARVDELHIDDKHILGTLRGTLNQIARTQALAELLGRRSLATQSEGRVAADHLEISMACELIEDLACHADCQGLTFGADRRNERNDGDNWSI